MAKALGTGVLPWGPLKNGFLSGKYASGQNGGPVDTTRAFADDPTDNLARTGANVTTIEKSAHFGHGAYYNDGDRTNSEDSFDQENKTVDWWGYTWSRPYWTNRVVYTTGQMFSDGGWFSDNLRVQVRQNFHWADVQGTKISPAYPYDSSAGPNKTYTFTFPGYGVTAYA